MSRKLLLLSYWFPPNNVIGASRAAAIAQFFEKNGWDVTVLCADSSAVSKDFSVDLTDIDVHRVKDTTITRFLNFRAGRKRWVRVLSALARQFTYPDGLRSTTSSFKRVADTLLSQGREFDVVFSTALPFSQHAAAVEIAKRAGASLVLDNRDTWACNIYRRRLPLSCWFERYYEHRILSNANLISTISDGMTEHYRKSYPDLSSQLITVRNGVDNLNCSSDTPLVDDAGRFRIVYTGILYGGKRDVRPILEAAQELNLSIGFDFYGSESECVDALKRQYPSLDIVDHGRVSRSQAIHAQLNSSALLVALGKDFAEKSFLPGKFFEYIGSGRPIIAIADEDSEICRLIAEHDLGVGTREKSVIASFLSGIASGDVVQRTRVPNPLTRSYHLSLLENEILECISNGKDSSVPMGAE